MSVNYQVDPNAPNDGDLLKSTSGDVMWRYNSSAGWQKVPQQLVPLAHVAGEGGSAHACYCPVGGNHP